MIEIKELETNIIGVAGGCQTWSQLRLVLQSNSRDELELVQRRICAVLSMGKYDTMTTTETKNEGGIKEKP